ncbi:unnamed protein product [Cyprideis torosa]|uniref:Uncharacterized protein n=1 Tax=Cyprideis torosa TaxID=163714 RepID=A0A7R8ZND7_9CRUS|nr:unnamed protein product [Cyprideis torosa]CAG0897774.1 unnamed protein product [Cyprideis torosa]
MLNCPPQKLQCESCGKEFTSKAGLKLHEKSHSDERDLKCSDCDYATFRKSLLDIHIASKHGPGFSCPSCPKRFATKLGLKKHHDKRHAPTLSWFHQRSARAVSCIRCNAEFKLKQDLLAHSLNCQERFQCEDCGKLFAYKHGGESAPPKNPPGSYAFEIKTEEGVAAPTFQGPSKLLLQLSKPPVDRRKSSTHVSYDERDAGHRIQLSGAGDPLSFRTRLPPLGNMEPSFSSARPLTGAAGRLAHMADMVAQFHQRADLSTNDGFHRRDSYKDLTLLELLSAPPMTSETSHGSSFTDNRRRDKPEEADSP